MVFMRLRKRLGILGTLSAMLLSSVGCIGSWRLDRIEKKWSYKPNRDRVIVKTVGKKTKTILEFDIASDYAVAGDTISIGVTKSENKIDYIIKERVREKIYESFEHRYYEKDIIFGKFYDTITLHNTGKTKVESVSLGLSEEQIGEKIIYENEPAKNVSVTVKSPSSIILRSHYVTNDGGLLRIPLFVGQKNRALSRQTLENQLDEIDLVKQIRPNVRRAIMSGLIDDIMVVYYGIEFMTSESPEGLDFNDKVEVKIENDFQNIIVKGFELSDSVIYDAVKQFVDEEINPRIKSVNFTVKDFDSHIRVRGANYVLDVNSPTKLELANRYFIGDLRRVAARAVGDYINGSIEIERAPVTQSFSLYLPTSPTVVSVEVTHKDYTFFKGRVPINRSNTNKIIYMSEKGKKIRVKVVDDDTSRVE